MLNHTTKALKQNFTTCPNGRTSPPFAFVGYWFGASVRAFLIQRSFPLNKATCVEKRLNTAKTAGGELLKNRQNHTRYETRGFAAFRVFYFLVREIAPDNLQSFSFKEFIKGWKDGVSYISFWLVYE